MKKIHIKQNTILCKTIENTCELVVQLEKI